MLAGEPEGVADDDELSEHPDAISAVLKHRAVKIPMYFPIGREFLIFVLFFSVCFIILIPFVLTNKWTLKV